MNEKEKEELLKKLILPDDLDKIENVDIKELFPPDLIGNMYPNPETFRDQFMPNYPIRKVDYNLNALSYYHFLGRYNDDIRKIFEILDRLLHRDLTVESTPSIEFLKEGDWRRHGKCLTYDDIINLKANVKISLYEKQMTIDYLEKTINLVNAISIRTDKEGIYAPDYLPYLEALKNKMEELENHFNDVINDITNQLNVSSEGLKKIVNNLYKSGAITSNDLKTFEFKDRRDIVTGNLNVFANKLDSDDFIRSNDNKNDENSIVAGID